MDGDGKASLEERSVNSMVCTSCNILWLQHINHQQNYLAYNIDQRFLIGGNFAPHSR